MIFLTDKGMKFLSGF